MNVPCALIEIMALLTYTSGLTTVSDLTVVFTYFRHNGCDRKIPM